MVSSKTGIAGSSMAVLALALLFECVKGFRVFLQSRLHHQKEEMSSKRNTFQDKQTRSAVLNAECSKTFLFVTQFLLAYFLMLIAMTCNTWLFLAVVIGHGVGYYLITPIIDWYVCRKKDGDCHTVLLHSPLMGRKREPLEDCAYI